MADSAGNWCLIESDPGVFSELIREFGNYGLRILKFSKTGQMFCLFIVFFAKDAKEFK